jgi:hypothetical protein
MLNDLRVPERHVVRISHNELRRPGKSLFRYFLGVKWSQVQILSARPLSARPGKAVFDLLFSVAETAIKVQLLFVWDHVFGCEAFFGRTCPMVK